MSNYQTITPEQMFFAVFCIESLADDLMTSGDCVYKALTEDSDILDSYIIPSYDALHTQGKDYIISDIKDLMSKRGISL